MNRYTAGTAVAGAVRCALGGPGRRVHNVVQRPIISDPVISERTWAGRQSRTRVRGGNAYRFHQPVVATDILHVDWSVESAQETNDSRGKPMWLVVSLSVYRNQHGHLLAENRETIFYRRSAG